MIQGLRHSGKAQMLVEPEPFEHATTFLVNRDSADPTEAFLPRITRRLFILGDATIPPPCPIIATLYEERPLFAV